MLRSGRRNFLTGSASREGACDCILNIGSSSGYYAVGLALRMPEIEVFAYDLDWEAREACERLAAENEVDDRLSLGGRFDGPEFEAFRGRRALVVCDIEGGEAQIIDPEAYPALKGFDLIVELHDLYSPRLSEKVPARFRSTHDVQLVEEGDHAPLQLPTYVRKLGAVERFIALHGGLRWGPTPWAVMWLRPL